MSNYYKKTTVMMTRRTTVTLKGGGTITTTKVGVLLQEVGIDIDKDLRVDPTWREDSTRGLSNSVVKQINAEMSRLGSLIDIKA